MPAPFSDLGSFLAHLEARRDLIRVRTEVDPHLEMTEIATRLVKTGGPAVLFERPKGSAYPVAVNFMATAGRLEQALGRPPAQIGEELASAVEDLVPPRPAALWRHRRLLTRAFAMRPRGAPGLDVVEKPDLGSWPVLTCWPDDGGRFVTLPLVITRSPSNGRQNLGMYRLHVYDGQTTGMHIQIERGGGAHHAEYEARGESMPVAVALGGDPVTILSSVLPLPEDMDELAFAGFLRGRRTRLFSLSNGLRAPADAEFVMEGHVPPVERRVEGPFGDHFGHYSHAAPFPVFHIARVHRRQNPIYPATVVGKPPQEDKFLGNAVQEMLLPLLKVMRPELVDLWAYFEAGFHNLAVASVRQRYPKEAIKTALGLMGQGQMSLTKCVVLVDPSVNVRNFAEVLDALRNHFNPADDWMLLPGTPQDTLDFTSFKMNLGSKMILDATSLGTRRPPPRSERPDRVNVDGLDLPSRNWRDALLAVRTPGPGRPVIEKILRNPAFSGYNLIAAVSDDVPLDDDELLLWGLFTRFDCARDVVPASVTMNGAWPVYGGPLGIDATWKAGYPKPLTMTESIVRRVDERWKEYGL